MAEEMGLPFLGEIPILRELREGGDTASPIVVTMPDHPVSVAFKSIAAKVLEQVESRSQLVMTR